MAIGSALVPDGETPEPMEPRDRAFDDPAHDAEPAAMRRAAPREDRDDAALPKTIAMRLRVVPAIALERVGPPPRPSAAPADRGQCLDGGIELRMSVIM